MKPADSARDLRARALRLLARREHSRAELERKLAPHAESPQALHALLDLLVQKRQLSEERYAEERARQLARKYGAARIREDLRSRGVGEELVRRVSAEGELERARAILQRKYKAPASTREEQAKRARFLLGRGFSGEVIRAVIRSSS